MGWYFTRGATKADVIKELTDDQQSGVNSFTTLAQAIKGNVLWTVHESKRSGTVARFIGCYLLEAGSDGWGYKPMECCMGPYYYTCPKGFLDLAPAHGESCKAWRAKIRPEPQTAFLPAFDPYDCGGAFDGNRVISDADPGL